jgi:hypothetical protein
MTWLLSKITNNPMVLLYVAGISFAAGLASGAVPAWKYQAALKEVVQAKFDSFVAQTKAEGVAAQKIAAAKDAQYKLDKENSDEQYKNNLADAAVVSQRLLHDRSSRGYLPQASATSSHPDRACFNRLQLGEAIRELDAGVQGIVDQGDRARIGLDTGRVWTKSVSQDR